jgi:acyl carrier protein
MTEDSRAATVRQIVRAHARIDLAEILDGHVLTRDLGFDSLAFLLTLSDLEDRLRFRFPLEEVDRLRDISVAELVRLVETEHAPAGREPGGDAPGA